MTEDSKPSDPVAELGQKLSKRLGGRGLAVRALPVFDLRKGTASTFACVPSRMGSETNAFGHWLLQGLDEASLASLDLEMLDVMIGYAKRFSDAKLIAAVACTVAYSTLTNPRARKDLLDKLNAAKDATSTPLLIKIELIPTGTPTFRLSEVVQYLKAAVRLVFVSIDEVQGRSTWNPGAVGASGIGLMLKPEDDAATARAKAQRLTALCSSQGAVPFVDGVYLPEVAEVLAAENVRFGTGPAFSLSVFPLNGGLPKVPLPAR
jgi:hypothetical protein